MKNKPAPGKAQAPATEHFLYTPCPAQADAVRIGWAYPYTYAVSMSSLGYLSLFRQLDEQPDVAIRRINTDSMASESIHDIELMGFSFSFELDILEVLRMLDVFHLPAFSAERTDGMPLIFAGGPVVMTNPEPYADFFDFYLIGEGEDLMRDLVAAFKRHRHLPRKEQLLALALDVPGLYAPSLYEVSYEHRGPITAITPLHPDLPYPVEKRFVPDLDTVIASSPIVTTDTIFSNTFLVEVMRGCAHRCRFCLASYSMLPARGPSFDHIQRAIEAGLQVTDKIGLLGALIADHPDFDGLCDWLQAKDDIQITAASFRADTLTPNIAKTFHKGGQQTLTLAVETGSERLRKRINKHLKTEAILNAARITAESGIPSLKLYMMAGLPGEDDGDIDETIALVKQVKKENPQLKVHVGCSTFVPKAATPFQWLERDASKTLSARQEQLRRGIVKFADFRPSSAKWDYVQAMFSRGDRRLSAFIVAFAQQGANLGALNRTLKALRDAPGGVDFPDPDWYALRQRDADEILPWDVLHLGVGKDVLYRESGLAAPPEPVHAGG